MKINKNAKIVGLWGGRGSGKSTKTKELIRPLKRVIVIDPIGDYAQEKGFKAVHSLPQLYKAMKADWAGFRLVLIIPRKTDAEAMLNQLADDLFLIQHPYKIGKDAKQLTLVVEEMSILYPEKTLAKNNRNFLELINLGRHSGVNIIGVSQRMAEVKKNFVGNCAEHYFFRMGSYADYAAVRQIVGGQQTEILKTLETHHYIHFASGKTKRGKNKLN